MTDKIAKEKRSETMKAVKSTGSALENKLSKALWHKGLRFRRNSLKLFGKPDLSIKKYKIVIFIDSCFWHGCADHCRMPKSNKEYWTKKINRNRKRDLEVNQYYSSLGWDIIRIWEHEFKDDFDALVEDILCTVHKQSN